MEAPNPEEDDIRKPRVPEGYSKGFVESKLERTR